METVETPVRKTGRPTTRLTARARSNSLGNQPLTPEAPLIVAIPPIVDLVVAEQPDRVEQPRVENATIPLVTTRESKPHLVLLLPWNPRTREGIQSSTLTNV